MASALGLLLCLLTVHRSVNALQPGEDVMVAVARQESAPFALSTSWEVLGPFQIGTREGAWGADPLEYVGGFHQLSYDPAASFRSSLPSNGTAMWSVVAAKQSASSQTSANISLSIGYENVDWDFLKTVYGWAAVQYQAWARGELVVRGNTTQHVLLYTDAIVEYWIDDTHFFGGDFYTFRRAPTVLHLAPGTHRIDLRLWRDVRAFGGINEPTIDVLLSVKHATGSLELAKPGILMSDVVNGKLASSVASVTLRNSGEDDIAIVDIQPSGTNSSNPGNGSSIVLIAGQTRSLPFNITLPTRNVSSVQYTIYYKSAKNGSKVYTLQVSQSLNHESIYSPHKFTFLHPSGIVSYAMLRAPATNATCKAGQRAFLPVLIANHGAGLEADNPMVAHALDPVPDLCAWVLFPTGVTPWSGDDWHNWGFADIEAAVASLPHWIRDTSWQGPGVDVNRWIVTGHSNGGQGTWYALTHRPDKLIAAAPLSGYASIQKYVPYELWQPADPRRTAIISASLNSYRHEMLMENAKGIPVYQQHGEIDDNVPAYNSRLLGQQLFQAGTNSSFNEFPGQNHWWDTVMTTDPLKAFYRTHTLNDTSLPRKLDEFTMIIGDPGDTGPKSGVHVLNLEDPGQYGTLHVKGRTITTSNILSLELESAVLGRDSIVVDDQELELSEDKSVVARTAEGWKIGAVGDTDGTLYRRGRQLGTLTAILRTQGPFIIRYQGESTIHVALQISRNFQQYFYADANIVSSNSSSFSGSGNVVSVCIGRVPEGMHPDFPIQASPSGVTVKDGKGKVRKYSSSRLGAVFLRPLDGERLELVVWGSDVEGLLQASRLVPTVTGVGQPDFVVLGESARWRGVEGAAALGFFDHAWGVTASSVVN